MAWLPGWNSPDSVATYRTLLEASSIMLLLVGSACGALAFLYNHRQAEMDRADKQVMRQQVAVANDSASRAHTEAQRLETELEVERQGRLLTPEKVQNLTQQLRDVPNPKAEIDLSGIQGDRENMRLAEQLAPLFREAGFTVNVPYENTVIGGIGKGIAIRQESKDGPTGVGLAAAFSAVGLESHVITMGVRPYLGPNKVEVIVGRRP